MINYYIKELIAYIFLLFLRFNLRKNIYQNFTELNFKENDFTNYKIIKHYILKDNFIKNITILDIHSFNFLFFKNLEEKGGLIYPKKIYLIGLVNISIIKMSHGQKTIQQKDLSIYYIIMILYAQHQMTKRLNDLIMC